MARQHRRKKRRTFGPKAARAIKAIVRGDIETKKFQRGLLPLTDFLSSSAAYLSGAPGASLVNMMQYVPRVRNTFTPSSFSVIGDEFMLRGLKVKLAAEITGVYRSFRVRCTLFGSTIYTESTTSLSMGNKFYEQQSQFNTPTFKPLDPDVVNIYKQTTFEFHTLQEAAKTRMIKMYSTKMAGKKHLIDDENVLSNSYVGQLKKMNYYLLVEWNVAGTVAPVAGTSSSNLRIYGDMHVYFKDP